MPDRRAPLRDQPGRGEFVDLYGHGYVEVALDQVQDAFRELERGDTRGKIVLVAS